MFSSCIFDFESVDQFLRFIIFAELIYS